MKRRKWDAKIVTSPFDVLPKKQTSLNWENAVPCSPPTQEGLR
jgi:hypothetical protein